MYRIQRMFLSLFTFCFIFIGSDAQGLDYKNIAAAPEEITAGYLQLPDPAKSAIASHSIMLPITLQQDAKGGWQSQHTIAVDDASEVKVAVFSPSSSEWNWEIQSPYAAPVSVSPNKEAGKVNAESAMLSMGNRRFPAKIVSLEQGGTGKWVVQVSAPGKTSTSGPDGYLLVSTRSPYRLNSRLLHYRLLLGERIGFSANVSHRDDPGTAIIDSITQARMRLHLPDGNTQVFEMFDNGTSQDAEANDGNYSVDFVAKQSGNYIAELIVSGISKEGLAFERSSTHTFPVLDNTLYLDNRATISKQNDGDFQLSLLTRGGKPSSMMRVAAELWGRDPAGGAVAISWISQMTSAQALQDKQALELTLDSGWLTRRKVRGPFELRNIRVQDAKTHIPFVMVERVPIERGNLIMPTAITASDGRITASMRMGKRPQKATGAVSDSGTGTSTAGDLSTALATTSTGRLLLVHGYCSAGNVWPIADFHDYAVFSDPNSNRSNDDFALRLAEFGSQFPSFGVVGHSQGGNAALHLYTYYWSGLDNASGGRLIQSVGSPYQGTSLAGNIAILGELFGAGCGSNWDLSYDGAALWLSGIPNWARSQVYYSSTSFTDRIFRYDYCSLATDLLLSDPEDGVTERSAAQLSGANNMGHKTGWCHTTDMRDPAQYLDQTRNLDMDASASR